MTIKEKKQIAGVVVLAVVGREALVECVVEVRGNPNSAGTNTFRSDGLDS